MMDDVLHILVIFLLIGLLMLGFWAVEQWLEPDFSQREVKSKIDWTDWDAVGNKVYNFLDCTAAPDGVKPNRFYARTSGDDWVAIDGNERGEINPDALGEQSRGYCRWLEKLP